jgi:hypothetical protein
MTPENAAETAEQAAELTPENATCSPSTGFTCSARR